MAQRYCKLCRLFFDSVELLVSHTSSTPQHHLCVMCDKVFGQTSALQTHRGAVVATGTINNALPDTATVDVMLKCKPCKAVFRSVTALNEHLKVNRRHNWCFLCSKDFSSVQALTDHLSSRAKAHSNRKTECPLCTQTFASPSSVAHHLESGCHGFNRHQVTAAAHNLDVIPAISISRGGDSLQTPLPLVAYIATQASFNGTSYECNLCRAEFETLRALNAHLSSAAHDRVEFKCPGEKCKKKTSLVSGLIQHIESGTCRVASLAEVEHFAQDLTAQFTRLLTG
ncbi:hypothetical protein BDN72DRAFT_758127 [Pluteus cervinus]|uniref:Uncharacterized protein n=1 Tax=Pluteus cervinus TaxID=181527 RepID=A0ACD3BB99_9AGAR|nr:hypothetical protein BDN72DRAFT_758127 [Pluteus cervinus]